MQIMRKVGDNVPVTTGVVQAIQSERRAQILREGVSRARYVEGNGSMAKCAECDDTGTVNGTARFCRCEAGRVAIARQRYDASWRAAIPTRYVRYSLKGHPNARARGAAERWLAGQEWNAEIGRNLVIMGPVGTGKTGLAIGILREAHYAGVEVLYTTLPEILAALVDASWKDKDAVMTELITIPLLLLDDLGTEHMTDWPTATLFQLIEGRYRNGAPTIITTNFAKKEMRGKVGDRVVSRIYADAVVLDIGGDDLRNKVVQSVYK